MKKQRNHYLYNLADRNLVSDELLQKRFGFDPEMEKSRIKQRKERKKVRKNDT